jgi:hypothetical protein
MFESNRDDDPRGVVVVDPDGLRLGEVEAVVTGRHAAHLTVVSGGIFGLARSTVLIPVEAVTKVDDRLHVDRTYAEVHRRRARGPSRRRRPLE